MKPLLALTIACLLLTGAAGAGTLTSGLQEQLASQREDDVVRVLVVLRDQVDLKALTQELQADKAGKEERHRRVLGALQEVAAASQRDLLASLGSDKTGGILGYTSHWLVNSVVVSATVRTVRDLARRPDVERIEPDLVVELIAPLPGEGPAPGVKSDNGIGTTPGVVAVNAPRVWSELGIDGTGVVVGILDTGVDGFHPALASRWRGNFAPAAECWLDAAGLGDASFPVDRHFHGTHVMGTLTGLAPGDTIGVAPGARWIAANVINHPGPLEAFDNAVIASLEFMADPDGNPATTADVPAVVQNSWGVRADNERFFPCDSRWWDAIDALEAAGVVVIWAAGNEGPNPETLRSPADRASSPLNAFAVGSTLPGAPYALSAFSSRGPSLCGGPYEIKPEVVAPGSNIYSAQPGGGYRYLSGTSMAGPHVAGVVALMRAASPAADVATIKQALLDTAVDLPPDGEDNGSGWGLVDAFAAVMAVKAGVGEVSGKVTDGATGMPLAGVRIQLVAGIHTTETAADGSFRLVLPAGPSAFAVTAFGYADGLLEVAVPDGGTAAGNIALTPRPWATVSGRVTGPDGAPVAGAVISADDTPLQAVLSDGSGAYSLALPAGPDLGYTLRARASGFGSTLAFVRLAGSEQRDFALPPAVIEDFESGGFTTLAWRQGGDTPWVIDAGLAWEGDHAARSGAAGGNGISRLELAYTSLDPGDLVFRSRVSSEAGYDFLRFYIDGVPQAAWSGDEPWTESRHALPAGPHVLVWSYEKDESIDVGDDAAWIDLIEFPAPATPLHAVAATAPSEVNVAVPPGETAVSTLRLVNAGSADLTFAVSAFATPVQTAGAANPVPHLAAAKTAPDHRSAVAKPTGSGGPDAFGYRWRDSDDPFGPEYAWIDIGADGTTVTLADDDNVGPFPLGFAFPFYGEVFAGIRIASNGFLSFTSTSPAWANQGIPDPMPPNHLLAAFWDDLSPNVGGRVLYRAEPERFIVQYEDVPHFGAPSLTETFQVVLTPDGAITYQYASVGDDGGCTVGIENGAGDDGLLVQFNAAGSLREGLAVRFRVETAPSWLTITPGDGIVPPAGEAPLTVSVDAADLAPGDYEAFVSLATNDPDQEIVTVPVRVTVRETADSTPGPPPVVVLTGAVPNPFNPQTEIRFALPAAADVSLRIYDVAGRLVRDLVAARLTAGPHRVPWNGRDGSGRAAASGMYFARLVVDGTPHVRGMTLLR